MKRYAGAIIALMMTFFSVTANAQVIDFENITTANIESIYRYGGFDWSNFSLKNLVGHVAANPGSQTGYNNMVTSGDTLLFNNGGSAASITKTGGGVFDVTSAYMGAAFNDGLLVTVTGWLKGQELYTKVITLNTQNPMLAVFDFSGIDKLSFVSSGGVHHPSYPGGGTHFTLDDMNFSPVTAVPEPSTYAMMFAGLAMMGILAKRRRVL